MTKLVGPSLDFCISFYGDGEFIGRAIAPPILPEPIVCTSPVELSKLIMFQ